MAKNMGTVFFVLLVSMSVIGFGQSDNSVSACFKRVKEAFPDTWEVVQADTQPSVSVQGWDGYRFVLSAGRKEYLNVSQQAMPVADPNADNDDEYVMKYSHIDLVLFLDPVQTDDAFLEKIPWPEVEQEYYVRPVYMGTGDGFHWFANTTLFWQEEIREKMKLKGGQDRIALLIDGLSIEDSGSCTRNSVTYLLAKHGDAAIPYLQNIIKESDPERSGVAFRVLGLIRTDRVTHLLREYYASKKTRELAAYALIHQPYRAGAEDEYIDMLKRRIRLNNAIDACEKLNIKEALPQIEDICEKPGTWTMYYQAYLTKRTLQGNPVSKELTEAYIEVKGPSDSNEIQRAKTVILAHPDKEAAAVMALNLIFLRGKIPTDRLKYFQKTGFDLLTALPEDITNPLIQHLLDTLDEEPSGTSKWLSPKDKLRQLYKNDN